MIKFHLAKRRTPTRPGTPTLSDTSLLEDFEGGIGLCPAAGCQTRLWTDRHAATHFFLHRRRDADHRKLHRAAQNIVDVKATNYHGVVNMVNCFNKVFKV